jgi:glycosyltransferase involved in cell wall biosynthesis
MTDRDGVVLDTRNPGVDQPDVSMIVPVFNVAPYIQACLESIRANQSDLHLELIIIDDGSEDLSHEVIEALLLRGDWPPLVYIRQSNQGLSAVRNRGAALARGDFLGFLDSDDLIVPGQLRRMLDFARRTRCDLVLGQTEIFDSATAESGPFYDRAYWDALMKGQTPLVTSAKESPDILSLEPNVNYRLISREFYQKARLSFPEGLLFEDAAVHLRMLLQAQAVALHGEVYYRYRINRPGKITEVRSRRRFDVLAVCHLAITELLAANASPAQAAAALRGLFRLAWGCGVMTLLDQRHAFFKQAVGLFGSGLPRPWMVAYLKRHRRDPKHALLGLLMTGGGDKVLAAWSSRELSLVEWLRFAARLFSTPRGKPASDAGGGQRNQP